MGGDRRRSLPTIDISPNDSDVEIVPGQNAGPVIGNTDGPSMAAFPLTRTTGAPPPRRRGRSILSKVVFLAVFSVALTLLACEISIAFKVPWLDPRPALVSLQRFAVGKFSKLRGR
jgi:hypothetical protein